VPFVTGPYVTGLRCRACGHLHDMDAAQVCERCWGPLDVAYDLDASAASLRHDLEDPARSMWRYAALLPVADPGEAGSGVGWTPLRRAEALGRAFGLGDLWLKDESANPTGSFKDRVVAVALSRARELGAEVAACASTGNLAASVAALAPRFGMRCAVLVPAGTPAIAAPGVVAVDARYDAINRLSVELADEHLDWAWVNVGLRAWYVEGGKTVGFEIAEQLGWSSPDHVVVPVASGALALKMHQGFGELAGAGLSDRSPRLSAAQPAGCAPVAAAFAAGADDIQPVRPSTIAGSLAMGDPPDGAGVLDAVRSTGGAVDAVPEADITPAVTLLGQTEGLATEPAGGVVVAAVRRLAARGIIRPDECVVAVVTAGGGPLSGRFERLPTIAASVDAFEAWWREQEG